MKAWGPRPGSRERRADLGSCGMTWRTSWPRLDPDGQEVLKDGCKSAAAETGLSTKPSKSEDRMMAASVAVEHARTPTIPATARDTTSPAGRGLRPPWHSRCRSSVYNSTSKEGAQDGALGTATETGEGTAQTQRRRCQHRRLGNGNVLPNHACKGPYHYPGFGAPL